MIPAPACLPSDGWHLYPPLEYRLDAPHDGDLALSGLTDAWVFRSGAWRPFVLDAWRAGLCRLAVERVVGEDWA